MLDATVALALDLKIFFLILFIQNTATVKKNKELEALHRIYTPSLKVTFFDNERYVDGQGGDLVGNDDHHGPGVPTTQGELLVRCRPFTKV